MLQGRIHGSSWTILRRDQIQTCTLELWLQKAKVKSDSTWRALSQCEGLLQLWSSRVGIFKDRSNGASEEGEN